MAYRQPAGGVSSAERRSLESTLTDAGGCAVSVFAVRQDPPESADTNSESSTSGSSLLKRKYLFLRSLLAHRLASGDSRSGGSDAGAFLVLPVQTFFQRNPLSMLPAERTVYLFVDGNYPVSKFTCARKRRFGPKYGVFRADILLGPAERVLDVVHEALREVSDDMSTCAFEDILQIRLSRSKYTGRGPVVLVSPWASPIVQLTPIVHPRIVMLGDNGGSNGNSRGADADVGDSNRGAALGQEDSAAPAPAFVSTSTDGLPAACQVDFRNWMRVVRAEAHSPLRGTVYRLELDYEYAVRALQARAVSLIPISSLASQGPAQRRILGVARDLARVSPYRRSGDALGGAEEDYEVDVLHLLGHSLFGTKRPVPRVDLEPLYSAVAAMARFQNKQEQQHAEEHVSTQKVNRVVFAYGPSKEADCIASIFFRFGARNGLRIFKLPDERDEVITNGPRINFQAHIPWSNVSAGSLDVLFHPTILPGMQRGPLFTTFLGTYKQALGPKAKIFTLVRDPLEAYFAHILNSDLAGRLQPFTRRAEGVQTSGLQDLLRQFLDGREVQNIQLLAFGLGRERAFETFMTTVLPGLDLVLVYERLKESLVLLRRMMNWSTSDILFLHSDLMRSTVRPASLQQVSKGALAKMVAATKLDQLMYRACLDRLDELIGEQDSDFGEEVLAFGKLLATMDAVCKVPDLPPRSGGVAGGKRLDILLGAAETEGEAGGGGGDVESRGGERRSAPAFCEWFAESQRSPHRFVHSVSGLAASIPFL